jgi:hypothetical protein
MQTNTPQTENILKMEDFTKKPPFSIFADPVWGFVFSGAKSLE